MPDRRGHSATGHQAINSLDRHMNKLRQKHPSISQPSDHSPPRFAGISNTEADE